jgi:hypothetical protein
MHAPARRPRGPCSASLFFGDRGGDGEEVEDTALPASVTLAPPAMQQRARPQEEPKHLRAACGEVRGRRRCRRGAARCPAARRAAAAAAGRSHRCAAERGLPYVPDLVQPGDLVPEGLICAVERACKHRDMGRPVSQLPAGPRRRRPCRHRPEAASRRGAHLWTPLARLPPPLPSPPGLRTGGRPGPLQREREARDVGARMPWGTPQAAPRRNEHDTIVAYSQGSRGAHLLSSTVGLRKACHEGRKCRGPSGFAAHWEEQLVTTVQICRRRQAQRGAVSCRPYPRRRKTLLLAVVGRRRSRLGFLRG